jgi:hypothetical protein
VRAGVRIPSALLRDPKMPGTTGTTSGEAAGRGWQWARPRDQSTSRARPSNDRVRAICPRLAENCVKAVLHASAIGPECKRRDPPEGLPMRAGKVTFRSSFSQFLIIPPLAKSNLKNLGMKLFQWWSDLLLRVYWSCLSENRVNLRPSLWNTTAEINEYEIRIFNERWVAIDNVIMPTMECESCAFHQSRSRWNGI